MEEMGISSQEMLDRLLREGKVTDDEYLRLSRALNRPGSLLRKLKLPPYLSGFTVTMPWQVWVGIVNCALCSFGALILLPKMPATSIGCILLNAFFAYGLYRRIRWIYTIAVFVFICSIIVIFKNPFGAVIGFVVGMILLTARRHFSRPQSAQTQG
ncbi:MAG: hypothetical protein ABFD69_11195 [Candidatus Sumerlaeia bacterium]